MKKLIIADALIAYIEDYACLPCKKYGVDREGIRCKLCAFGFCLDGISRHKAVEAIPIEWIKKWLNGSRTSGLSIDVMSLLIDWEKENEAK